MKWFPVIYTTDKVLCTEVNLYKINNISQHFEICGHGKHYATHLVSDEIQVTVLARHTSKGTLLLMELQENQAHTVRRLNPHGYMNSCKILQH